jgi:hypothetical protein
MKQFIFEPETRLRGTRDYVHSTDLYEQIVAGARAAGLSFHGPLDFRIRGKITHRPRFAYQLASLPADPNVVTCTFTSGNENWMAVVSESDEIVTACKPYDEGPAAKHSIVVGLKASLNGQSGMRPIEALTALAVHLHKTSLPPPAGRRWMLGRLSTSRVLSERDGSLLTLDIDKQIGTSTTRTRITAHDGVIGSMIFILEKGLHAAHKLPTRQ